MADLREKLSEHFTLDEFTRSETAERQDIDNTPPEFVIDNLQNLCVRVLEPLREALGPVLITSGYRCAALNVAIGGSKTSSHMEGKAADLSVKGKTLAEVYNWLLAHKDELGWDQIIREFPPRGWIHCSFDALRSRKQGLLASRQNGKTVYAPQDTPVNS